jgi:hypothetical protein
MIVEIVRAPLIRNMLVHEHALRRREGRIWLQQSQSFRHSEMMSIDDEDTLS